MGRVEAGDILFDETGAPCRVVQAHPIQLGRPCYRVRFSDGSEIVADEDHLWLTIDRRTRKALRRRYEPQKRKRLEHRRLHPRVVTTAEIAATLMDGKERNHAIPTTGALQCPDADLPVAPYLLGLWLGDGHTASAEITSADDEVREAFAAAGFGTKPRANGNAGKATTYSISGGFKTQLRRAGVVGNKHVPAAYLRASESQRRALLAGLLDTDGFANPDNGNVEFCSKSERLAQGVRELALSLGFKAVIYIGRATLNGRDCGPKYRVCFQAHGQVFGLSRKDQALRPRGNQSERAYRRYIVAVDPVPSVPVRCITVDSPSRLFLAGEAMIPTHNTRSGVQWLLEQAAIPGREAMPLALVGRTAADVRDVLVEGPAGVLACSPPWNRPHYEPSKRRLTWRNGATATTFSAEEPDALRGPQFRAALADEIAAWPYFEDAWSNLQMCTRLGDDPRIAALTTPRPLPHLREIMEDPANVVIRGGTLDNAMNLAKRSVDLLFKRYGGTRLGRQELEGELLMDLPGALWTAEMISDANKNWRAWGSPFARDLFERIVVGLDPSGSDGDGEDEGDAQGIVVAGKLRGHRRFVVLEDLTGRRRPEQWAKVAAKAAKRWAADCIVAEKNFGGAMVRATLHAAGVDTAVRMVTASKGKTQRAEPISALYEQGLVGHASGQIEEPPEGAGAEELEAWRAERREATAAGLASNGLTELEKELGWFTGSGVKSKVSPNRADAKIWALTNLAYGQAEPQIRSLA